LKYFLKVIRKIFNLLGLNYRSKIKTDLKSEEVSNLIFDKLSNSEPFLVARIGANEFNCMTAFNQSNLGRKKYFDYLTGKFDYYEFNRQLIMQTYSCAGVFPPEESLMIKFAKQSLEDLKEVDILGVWLKENNLLEKELVEKIKIPLKDIEPYFHKKPWTKALKDKKVLVIHPFSSSIQNQYKKRELLFRDKDILPEFKLLTLKAVQSIAGENTSFETWFDALNYMKNEIDKIDFDVAIIGCGAYGLSLGAHIKKLGKQAIHMGGATQILFGIKGKRWDEHPVISKLYNDYWIKALPEETPKKKNEVENGCYW
jgi:hypothetical protein